MTQETTYCLQISFSNPQLKNAVTTWLPEQGFAQFIEGTLDDLDIPWNYGAPDHEVFASLHGDNTPILIYSYHAEELQNLARLLAQAFPDGCSTALSSFATQSWQDGWKDSFQPIVAGRFYVYPSWTTDPVPENLLPILIDPGMAFGTGQHATTLACLTLLDRLPHLRPSEETLLDVGTGTGILAIAAAKMGFKECAGCDVDKEAVLAAEENCARNGVSVQLWLGSLDANPAPVSDPKKESKKYSVIFANILLSVLQDLMPQLRAALQPKGRLIVSGILDEQQDALLITARNHGLRCSDSFSADGWAGLVLE